MIREEVGQAVPLRLYAILHLGKDVILPGKIRDMETAKVAFHAAQADHQSLEEIMRLLGPQTIDGRRE